MDRRTALIAFALLLFSQLAFSAPIASCARQGESCATLPCCTGSCVSGVCTAPPPPTQVTCQINPSYSYLDVVADPAGGLLTTSVYEIQGDYNKVRIKGALVYRVTLRTNIGPTSTSSVCYDVTDANGNIDFPYNPTDRGCTDYWFIYCPDAGRTLESQERCLQGTPLKDADIQNPNIPACRPGATGTATSRTDTLLSQNEFYYCNVNPNAGGMTELCWPLMILFGLLVGASFAAGKNPFQAFDFTAPRMSRGRQYTMRTKQMSFDAMTYGYGSDSATAKRDKNGKILEQGLLSRGLGTVANTTTNLLGLGGSGWLAKLMGAKTSTKDDKDKEKLKKIQKESTTGMKEITKTTGTGYVIPPEEQQRQQRVLSGKDHPENLIGVDIKGGLRKISAVREMYNKKIEGKTNAQIKEMTRKERRESKDKILSDIKKNLNFSTVDNAFDTTRSLGNMFLRFAGLGGLNWLLPRGGALWNITMWANFARNPTLLPYGLNAFAESIETAKASVGIGLLKAFNASHTNDIFILAKLIDSGEKDKEGNTIWLVAYLDKEGKSMVYDPRTDGSTTMSPRMQPLNEADLGYVQLSIKDGKVTASNISAEDWSGMKRNQQRYIDQVVTIRDQQQAPKLFGNDDKVKFRKLKTRKEELKAMLGFVV